MSTHHEERELTRDVQATLIPHGDPYTLDKGAKVTITHRLGGNFTVMTLNGMYRISAADADSLGEDDSQAPEEDCTDAEPADEDSIRDALRSVFDPEIPVNVVDLGLIYKIKIDEDEEGKGRTKKGSKGQPKTKRGRSNNDNSTDMFGKALKGSKKKKKNMFGTTTTSKRKRSNDREERTIKKSRTKFRFF